MLKKFFLLIFGLIIINLYSQEKHIDSLRRILTTSKKPTFKVYNELGWQFASRSVDSLTFYHKKSAPFVKTEIQKSLYLNQQAVIDFFNQNFEAAKKNIQLSNFIAKKKNDYKTIASNYNILSKIEFSNGRYDQAEILMKISYYNSLRTKNRKDILKSIINYGSILIENNKTQEGIYLYNQSEKYFGNNTEYEQGFLYRNIARTYLNIHEFKLSEVYWHKSLVEFAKIGRTEEYFAIYMGLAELAIANKNLPEIYRNIQLLKGFIKNELNQSDYYFLLANYYHLKKEYHSAEIELLKSIKIDEVMQNEMKLGEDYLLLGNIMMTQQKYKKAKTALQKAERFFSTQDDALNLKETYYGLLQTKLFLNQDFASVNYLRKLDSLNNSLYDMDKHQSILELHTKYKTLEKEAQIKSQQLELQKEKTNKYLSFGGTALLLLLSSGGYFWFRNKDKQKKLETQNSLLSLQFDLNKMELQSLNKQLDPHEIKNLLASISPEIQEKAPESYRKMLKLLNITKASLNNSSMTESVKNQVQQIDDFLSLEKNSFSVPFDYSIQDNIETKNAQIPRLMLKNLAENAIKHGIKRSENGGEVNIILTEENQFFKIIVDDTGKGRKLDTISDTGIGTSTYRNLFATLNKKNTEAATFEIIDKKQGTKVKVKIPTNYKYD